MADLHGLIFVFTVVWLLFITCQANDEDLVTRIVERLRLQERRIHMEISLLREEFQNEIALISTASIQSNDVSGKAEPEYSDIKNLTDSFEKRVYKTLDSLKLGMGKEKIFRRDLQAQLNMVKKDNNDLQGLLQDLMSQLVLRLDPIANILTETFENNRIENVLKTVTDSQAKPKTPAKDCAELYRLGHVTSGIYSIHPDLLWRPLEVFCDMETDGGGWTVFQRRIDGSEDFFRTWLDYRFGFGNLSGEFWLGNEFIHRLVSVAPHELRIELEDFESDLRYAKYMLFSVGPVEDGFRLSIDGYVGNVSDTLESSPHHDGSEFSTKDKGPAMGCSNSYKGGFWYGHCHSVNINGLYLKGKHESYADGVNWSGFRGQHYSLKFTEMKFRPK